MDHELAVDENGNHYIKIALKGHALLTSALLNKGTAFTESEREAFGLIGLLPHRQANLALQRMRSYEAFHSKNSDIEKYIYLRDLQDSNETLFYNLLAEYIDEMLPIVYTPTVGVGCQRYSHIYRRPRGLYLSYPDRHFMRKALENPNFDQVKIIVLSDGERILGLGDQGAGGMGIPIGKLALYIATAGIHPAWTLPILLDTGTDNLELHNDPLYIGWGHPRIRGAEYDDFIAQFIEIAKERFPHVLIHWEDFAQQNAHRILNTYRDQLCTFNDDIQGTAAVAAGTLLAAIEVTGLPLEKQRALIFGAGSAGCGISQLILNMMVARGLPENEACKQFFLVDKDGLLLNDAKNLLPFQRPFAQSRDAIASWQLASPGHISLLDVVKNARPTLLIGTSSQAGAFNEEVVREMHKHVARPIIFPLSNPTHLSEATPNDLMRWTEDQAIIGTGSPFGTLTRDGELFRVDQTNNCYIFPGIGLGSIAVKAKRISDHMFMAAAKALADCSPAKNNPKANLLPPLKDLRDVAIKVAVAVATDAVNTGLGEPPKASDLESVVRQMMWSPQYLPYKKWER